MQQYRYSEKFSWGYAFLAAFGVGTIVYALIEPFEITLGRMTILSPPWSNRLTVVVGVLFILWGIASILRARALSSAGVSITVHSDKVSVPVLKGFSVVPVDVPYASVNELWAKEDEDDGKSIVLYWQNNRAELFADNFDSPHAFTELQKLLDQRCTNITNRS